MKDIGSLDWDVIISGLDADGFARTGPLLSTEECESLVASYDDDSRFRSRVVMAKHGFGAGEYKYFGYPLPDLVQTLRREVYPRLVPLANRWVAATGGDHRIRTIWMPSRAAVMLPGRPDRHHCCCATVREITTGCTVISTATWHSRFRWRFC